jgi:hypothetical protein
MSTFEASTATKGSTTLPSVIVTPAKSLTVQNAMSTGRDSAKIACCAPRIMRIVSVLLTNMTSSTTQNPQREHSCALYRCCIHNQ